MGVHKKERQKKALIKLYTKAVAPSLSVEKKGSSTGPHTNTPIALSKELSLSLITTSLLIFAQLCVYYFIKKT